MKQFPPNINPGLFAISAVAVGVVLVDGFTVNEQNAIANWLMLVGQYIETSAAQQQLIEGRLSAAESDKTLHGTIGDQSDESSDESTSANQSEGTSENDAADEHTYDFGASSPHQKDKDNKNQNPADSTSDCVIKNPSDPRTADLTMLLEMVRRMQHEINAIKEEMEKQPSDSIK